MAHRVTTFRRCKNFMGRPGKKINRLTDAACWRNDDTPPPGSLNYEDVLSLYRADTPLAHRKRFGQFFTPRPIAALMTDWIMAVSPKTILDPAVGPGVFVADFVARGCKAKFFAMDVDPNVLQYARAIAGTEDVEFLENDFLHFANTASFDAIIANPPYLRHHDFSYASDIFAEIGSRNNIPISKLTNIYALFILEICRRLNPAGRAAIIIPTEWTNANFGMAIKRFLLERGLLHTFIYFTHEALPFSDALTTACVLLIEKPELPIPRPTIRTLYLSEAVDLANAWGVVLQETNTLNGAVVKDVSSSILAHAKKWDFLLQNDSVEALPGLVALRTIAKTRRGIATGANDFFHLSHTAAAAAGIRPAHLAPCIGRASDVEGVVFDTDDFNTLVHLERRTHLVNIVGQPNTDEDAYLARGEKEGLPERYLLAARKKWYEMEKRPAAAIWAAVFGRSGLRFIRNRANIQNLTTFHCIYPLHDSDVFADALTVCLNSRFVQERARRQHRVYGGGLLKMEPKDLLDIEVPDLSLLDETTLHRLAAKLSEIDRISRTKETMHQDLIELIDEMVKNAIAQAASKLAQHDLFEGVEV